MLGVHKHIRDHNNTARQHPFGQAVFTFTWGSAGVAQERIWPI
jgi:hypothetical protein